MFNQITPDQFEAIKIMLAYAAGVATIWAAVYTTLHILEMRAGKRAFMERHPSRRKQMLDEDLDAIDQAINIANS